MSALWLERHQAGRSRQRREFKCHSEDSGDSVLRNMLQTWLLCTVDSPALESCPVRLPLPQRCHPYRTPGLSLPPARVQHACADASLLDLFFIPIPPPLLPPPLFPSSLLPSPSSLLPSSPPPLFSSSLLLPPSSPASCSAHLGLLRMSSAQTFCSCFSSPQQPPSSLPETSEVLSITSFGSCSDWCHLLDRLAPDSTVRVSIRDPHPLIYHTFP